MKYFFYILFVFIYSSQNIFAQAKAESLKREALTLMQAGRYGEAIDQLNKYVTANPRIAEGYNLRGLCFEKRAEYQYAVLDFRRAIRLDPDNVEIKRNLDRVLAIWHQLLYNKIEGHKREIAIDPKVPWNYLEIGKSYRWLEIWDLAEQWYDEYLKRDDNASPDEIIRYTEILAKTGSIKKGERILEKYVERYPDDWRLWSRYGYFTLWLGNYSNARKAFESALSYKPFFKEAQDGLDLTKREGYLTQYIPRAFERVYPIDAYYRSLQNDPYDMETRFRLLDELIKAQRFEEASQQLGILTKDYADTDRYRYYAVLIDSLRTSLYDSKIEEYSAEVKMNPKNKQAVIDLANSYGKLYSFDEALEILEEYLVDIPDNQDLDVRFLYSKYAAWNFEWEKSIEQLDKLLELDPGNLDYQLLRGQISVWTVLDLDPAQKYLENVLEHRPEDINALLALASLHSWKKEFPIAKSYIDKAKELDPVSRDVLDAESNYFLHVSASEELETLQIRAKAGELVSSGNCEEAVQKYDEYLSKITGPTRQELKEYADINACAKNYYKAIEVYDQLLNEEYEFDLALQRAKLYLWSDDSLKALSEFQNLSTQKPDDFDAKLFLGESYARIHEFDKAEEIFDQLYNETKDPEKMELLSQNMFATKLFIADSYAGMREYGKAEDLYGELIEGTTDTAQIHMLQQRIDWIPPYGLGGGIHDIFNFLIPDQVGLSPQFNYYRDNQSFQFYNFGGRLEMGMANWLSVGVTFLRTNLNSQYFNRYLNTFKGHVAIIFESNFVIDGGYGKINTFPEPQKDVYNITLRYEKPEVFAISGLFDHNDARLILYSPQIINYNYNANLFRIFGYYKPTPLFYLSGYYQYISVTDGNKGNDVQFKVGRRFFDEALLGYEYFFSDYYYSSAIYFSPQKFESHSIWGEWDAYTKSDLVIKLGGKIGYYPSVDFIINEIFGDFKYTVYKYLTLSLRLTAGTTYRFEASYNYVSAMFSAYWSIL